ncbi:MULTISPECIES: FapA family protein [unclassified Virgibacillus]|uniref:DUF342 domain-containing protein n=1 Tax=unclassified Virgibacillus TaxID=2620237 RepID=UPI0024DEBA80|nr:FapA family protein [Virgibacillus sp. LDC-1]
MEQLQRFFKINNSKDRMNAYLHCTDEYSELDVQLHESDMINFLKQQNIRFGIIQENVQLIVSKDASIQFPLLIAQGTPAQHGKDSETTYEFDFSTEITKSDDWNFRDVMRIPSVKSGQRLATITEPTKGQDGMDIFGNKLAARDGKPSNVKPGKHVIYKESDLSFYADADGQVSVNDRFIHVHNVYELNETITMKTGNIDFVGSIIIKGDIPSGYTVKAEGDIKVFGMVEAATVISGGSIMISEGLAGLQKGVLKAADSIHIGYINQGIVHAGKDLYVENSILHSECTAENQVFCQRGNIIGGSLSAGKSIEAKDIGNRLNTKTELYFGIMKEVNEREQKLNAEKKELQATLIKLEAIGKKLAQNTSIQNQDAKMRITLLRQQNSMYKVKKRLEEIDSLLQQTNASIGKEEEATLLVRDHLFPNVIVSFGKYKRLINTNHKYVKIKLEQNEIVINSL